MKKIAILTGAGISAESGIKTFRDNGGLWEEYDVMEVASIDGWHKNKELVIEFYNQRRSQLKQVLPNDAHLALPRLESRFDVVVITQNVDDLHEKAGSSNILHLHGELNKVRSIGDENLIYEWQKDLKIGDKCSKGHQLRPHIVWFGEEVPLLHEAIEHVKESDIIIVIGTSLQVYPAAGLCAYARADAPIYYCDKDPQPNHELRMNAKVEILPGLASEVVPSLIESLIAGED